MPSYQWIEHFQLLEKVKLLENNVKELQSQLQEALKRIKELKENTYTEEDHYHG